ncbi:MAG: carboxymuconolactone decarboxylase family protein [Neomegalonema sp.]|nr:carboxymuconolactone decarboxylase family protein [Neomegalonema sp.]
MTDPAAPLAYDQHIPEVFQAFIGAQTAVSASAIPAQLAHLVRLRASQLNGCAYCVDMHLREARADGERNERLDRLVVWRHVPDFTDREKAALAWVEALTQLKSEASYGPLRAQLRQHFSDKEISSLTVNIAMINLWNRIMASGH